MGQPVTSSTIHQQRLWPVQEQCLVDQIAEQATLNNPPSLSQIREIAITILQIQRDKKSLDSK